MLWNGPMGVFEWPRFAAGTIGIAHALAELTDKVCCPPLHRVILEGKRNRLVCAWA